MRAGGKPPSPVFFRGTILEGDSMQFLNGPGRMEPLASGPSSITHPYIDVPHFPEIIPPSFLLPGITWQVDYLHPIPGGATHMQLRYVHNKGNMKTCSHVKACKVFHTSSLRCLFSHIPTGWVSPNISILVSFWRWKGEEILMWNICSPNTVNHKQNRQWKNLENGWFWGCHVPHSNPTAPPWELCGRSEGASLREDHLPFGQSSSSCAGLPQALKDIWQPRPTRNAGSASSHCDNQNIPHPHFPVAFWGIGPISQE